MDQSVDGLGEALLVLAARAEEKVEGELRPEHRRDIEQALRLLVEGRKTRRRPSRNLLAGGDPTVDSAAEGADCRRSRRSAARPPRG